MMRTNKWIYRRPTGDINGVEKQLKHSEHKCQTCSGSKTHLVEAPVLQLDTWNCKERKKVWILRKQMLRQPWGVYVNSCAGTLSLGLALQKQPEAASNRASESLHPAANPNKPSAVCSLLIMFCGWKREGKEEEEETAKRLKATNASNQIWRVSGLITARKRQQLNDVVKEGALFGRHTERSIRAFEGSQLASILWNPLQCCHDAFLFHTYWLLLQPFYLERGMHSRLLD